MAFLQSSPKLLKKMETRVDMHARNFNEWISNASPRICVILWSINRNHENQNQGFLVVFTSNQTILQTVWLVCLSVNWHAAPVTWPYTHNKHRRHRARNIVAMPVGINYTTVYKELIQFIYAEIQLMVNVWTAEVKWCWINRMNRKTTPT